MNPIRWLLVPVIALSGCATTVPEQMAALAGAPVCCQGYSKFSYVPLQLDQPQSVKLGPDSPAFVFDSGKSYFFAGRLPAYSGPLVLKIDSQGSVAGALSTSVLRPEVLMLDAAYQVTRRIPGEDFKHTRASDFRGSVFINRENAAETYVVIFTRTAAGEQVKQIVPITAPVAGVPVTFTGTERTLQMAFGPTGSLALWLQRYQPMHIGP